MRRCFNNYDDCLTSSSFHAIFKVIAVECIYIFWSSNKRNHELTWFLWRFNIKKVINTCLCLKLALPRIETYLYLYFLACYLTFFSGRTNMCLCRDWKYFTIYFLFLIENLKIDNFTLAALAFFLWKMLSQITLNQAFCYDSQKLHDA